MTSNEANQCGEQPPRWRPGFNQNLKLLSNHERKGFNQNLNRLQSEPQKALIRTWKGFNQNLRMSIKTRKSFNQNLKGFTQNLKRFNQNPNMAREVRIPSIVLNRWGGGRDKPGAPGACARAMKFERNNTLRSEPEKASINTWKASIKTWKGFN